MRMRRAEAATRSAPGRRRFRRRARGVSGLVRIDPRTKDLLRRLNPGEIAVVLHEDLDGLAAEGLVERGASAVVNCHRSTTGRYPNAGPLVLARAGIPLLDAVGESLLERIAEGDLVRVEGAAIYKGDELVGTGALLDGARLQEALNAAQGAIGDELERFVRNTMEYLDAERDLMLRGAGIPELKTGFAGRHAVVVVRGSEYRKDLEILRGYIADMRPVLVAVDGAADAMLDRGMRPDVIVGDMDSVSTQALGCGAELVVHAYPDGRAPGWERVRALGFDAQVFRSGGTSEDIALLLAYEKGADLIVAVGAHDNLIDFLDKGRGGMASTFLVRLKVGPRLVDAKGVNRLYRTQVRTSDLLLLVGSAAFAMAVAAYAFPQIRLFLRLTLDLIKDGLNNIF
jgi:uncharacterized membrane-anchored protein